jgi:hypothetical protein
VIERTFQTPGLLKLNLAIPNGTIDVETVEGDETHVVLEADDDRTLDNARVDLRQRGAGHELVVSVEKRTLLGGFVQISIGSISLGGGGYRLRVTAPHGADLEANTASADIIAPGSFGQGAVKTVSGDTTLGEFSADLEVKTVSGDVRVQRVGGRLTANSVSGDLRIDDAASDVQTKSISGDVKLVVAAGEVALTSVSGDIEVAVRRGSRLHVDANSVSGDLDSDVPLADAPGGEGADGPLVELRGKTVSGDFRVVRA